MKHHCHICYSLTDPEFICDKCEEHYCEDCSYTFTLHYQFQGSRCYSCADQRRREKLDMRDVRLNQIFMTNQLEDIKKKVQAVRKVRQNNRRQFGTFKVNATWNKEAIEDLKKLQSYDSVQEMELKLIREMQSLNEFYIRNFFNI